MGPTIGPRANHAEDAADDQAISKSTSLSGIVAPSLTGIFGGLSDDNRGDLLHMSTASILEMPTTSNDDVPKRMTTGSDAQDKEGEETLNFQGINEVIVAIEKIVKKFKVRPVAEPKMHAVKKEFMQNMEKLNLLISQDYRDEHHGVMCHHLQQLEELIGKNMCCEYYPYGNDAYYHGLNTLLNYLEKSKSKKTFEKSVDLAVSITSDFQYEEGFDESGLKTALRFLYENYGAQFVDKKKGMHRESAERRLLDQMQKTNICDNYGILPSYLVQDYGYPFVHAYRRREAVFMIMLS